MDSYLKVKNLCKSYKNSTFKLDNISFTIDTNEIVGLIGKNGSGKSTLINTLVGNKLKNSGEIYFFGNSIKHNDVSYKQNIGVVFDDIRLPDKLNITQIDKVFSKIYFNWNSKKFNNLITFFELPIDQKLSTFSRGMSMKVSIAVALSHESRILLLDEATAGMDSSSREEVKELLSEFKSEGNSILITSHISDDIEDLADKLIFMKNGGIVFIISKDELYENYGIFKIKDMNSFNYNHPDIIASHSNKREALVKKGKEFSNVSPLKNIDQATNIIMRGSTR
ncbi:ABC transporter ATP-binding protein [Staphylococcus simulans]|nr:ABC transporter ATP-binding protein [Staphylococcus simulans]MEB6838066.1 ABC transporter ATP-binding protein [Staphylococcus simulans]